VPFSTSFVGDYPDDILADIIFEMNLMLLGLISFVQWFYAALRYRFVSAECTETGFRQDLHRILVIPLVSGTGIVLALSGSQDSTMTSLLTPLAF
jgi:uncharacterized membrane protein